MRKSATLEKIHQEIQQLTPQEKLSLLEEIAHQLKEEEMRKKTSPKTKKRNFLKALKATAGGWKDLIDAEELKRNIYEDRLITTRPKVKL